MPMNCSRLGLGGVNKQEIEQALRDYNWMIKEIKRQRALLGDYDGGNLTAHIDDMPKSKGLTGDPVADEVVRRDRNNRWLNQLEDKVSYIQKRIPVITEERERAVLECMLDGMSMVAIGRHMGLSRRHIYTIKESIISQFAQFAHNSREMTKV